MGHRRVFRLEVPFTIVVNYVCDACGIRDGKVTVPVKKNETWLYWFYSVVGKFLFRDHFRRSPGCHLWLWQVEVEFKKSVKEEGVEYMATLWERGHDELVQMVLDKDKKIIKLKEKLLGLEFGEGPLGHLFIKANPETSFGQPHSLDSQKEKKVVGDPTFNQPTEPPASASLPTQPTAGPSITGVPKK